MAWSSGVRHKKTAYIKWQRGAATDNTLALARSIVGRRIPSSDFILFTMVAVTKKTVKQAASKPAPAHPTYAAMIAQSIAALKDRNGSSRQKIAKHISENFKGLGDDSKVNLHVKHALKKALAAGIIVNSKGTGCSGSFKMVVKPKVEAKKNIAPVKKAAAKPKTVAKPKKTAKSPKKVKPTNKVKPSVTKKTVAKTKPKSPARKTAKKPTAKM